MSETQRKGSTRNCGDFFSSPSPIRYRQLVSILCKSFFSSSSLHLFFSNLQSLLFYLSFSFPISIPFSHQLPLTTHVYTSSFYVYTLYIQQKHFLILFKILIIFFDFNNKINIDYFDFDFSHLFYRFFNFF